MSIVLKDGTVLPDLPDGVITEETPYSFVLDSQSIGFFSYTMSEPLLVLPAGIVPELPIDYFVVLPGRIKMHQYQPENGWVGVYDASIDEVQPKESENIYDEVKWTNHDIYFIDQFNPDDFSYTVGTEIAIPSFVSKPPFILPDGTELPALPDGWSEGTPYGVITGIDWAGDGQIIYNAMFFPVPLLGLPVGLIPEDYGLIPGEGTTHSLTLPPAEAAQLYSLENGEWVGGEDTIPELVISFTIDIVLWANHDLPEITELNEDMSYKVGSTVVRKSDENYRVTGGYMTSIANEARRLGGKTGGMLPAVTEETLRSVTAGGGSGGYPVITELTTSNVPNAGYANAFHYANGLWVMATGGTGLYWSENGKAWTHSNVTDGYWMGVHYGNGIWVASSSTLNAVYYSTDGKTWTQSNTNVVGYGKPYYANGLWVMTHNNSGICYSTDGKTWTSRNINGSGFNAIHHANGLWVIGGKSTGLYYSTDGKTWSASNDVGASYGVNDIWYENGLWVASLSNSGICYSTDGKTWIKSNVTSGSFYMARYSNGIWVGCTFQKGFYYSTDGKTWTQSNEATVSSEGVCFCDGMWVATIRNDKLGIYVSFDGKTWCCGYSVAKTFYTPPCYANGVLVVCGDGTGIMYCTQHGA